MMESHSSSLVPLMRVAIPSLAHRFMVAALANVAARVCEMCSSRSERHIFLDITCVYVPGNGSAAGVEISAGVRAGIWRIKRSRMWLSDALAVPKRKRCRGFPFSWSASEVCRIYVLRRVNISVESLSGWEIVRT